MHFNPRSHEGSDLIAPVTVPSPIDISIHAPTRGATKYPRQALSWTLFQSTLPRGERQSSAFLHWSKKIFQSTLPRGERLWEMVVIFSQKYFNPRSHEGSDEGDMYRLISHSISIHAPTRGATAIFAKKFSFLSAKIV